MHVETKRIKRLLRRPDVVRPTYEGRFIAVADNDPELSVVFGKNAEGKLTVVTVLYRQYDYYDRKTGTPRDHR